MKYLYGNQFNSSSMDLYFGETVILVALSLKLRISSLGLNGYQL